MTAGISFLQHVQISNPSKSFLDGGGAMGAAMRAHDWSATPLGQPESWPPSLKTAISIMLGSRYQMWMAWGSDLTFFYNDAYRPTLGTKASWALGNPSHQVWAEIWKEVGPRVESVLKTGEATWDEGLLLFLERNGYPEETYHTFSYSPLRDDEGEIAGMLCVVTEETERLIGQRRMAALRDLAAELSKTQTAAEVGTAVGRCLRSYPHDLPFTMTYLFDEQGTRAQRLTASGIDANHPAAPLSVNCDLQGGLWPMAELLQTAGPIAVVLPSETSFPTGGWSCPPSKAIVYPIAQQGHEKPAGCLIAAANPHRPLDAGYMSFIDLLAGQIAASLANARAYENERKRAESLAEIDRAKTAFFSNVSHEFRTPLTLMLGPLEDLLQRKELPEPELEEIALIYRNGRRLLKLVNALLDFSRIEAGRIGARYQATDLAALTEDLASVFRAATDKAGLFLNVSSAPLREPVWVDREMWEKIVLNLISNAFKFTHEGGIDVKLADLGDRAQLSVRDTGIGIASDEMARLFERFHRIPGARGRTHEGSGIGLAMVQELVKLHGGHVEAESEPGRGSVFRVSIPFGQAHLPRDRIVTEAGQSQATAASVSFAEEALGWTEDASVSATPSNFAETALDPSPSPADEQKPRLVWADDNADMRAYVQRLLSPHYNVTAVGDGEAALAAIRDQQPALVLSDVMMPKLDGFGLLRALRNDEATKALPVILLSARAGEEARLEGLRAGVDDYLVKPFAARELLVRIGATLALSKLRQEFTEKLTIENAKLSAVLDSIPVGVWFSYDPDARFAISNRYAAELFGVPISTNLSATAPEGQRINTFRVLRKGEEIPITDHPLQRAARGEEVHNFDLEIAFDDDRRLDLMTEARPLLNANGGLIGSVCVGVDITERKRAEREMRLLTNELNHRVKNTLTIMQSVASQTARYTNDPATFQAVFSARMMALARAHDLLTREVWHGAKLSDVLDGSLAPFRDGSNIITQGPDIMLDPNAAVALSMAFHELATNAAKYGALTSPQGAVSIMWRSDRQLPQPLEISWIEKGGPPVAKPSKQGFGSRLIASIAAQLDGDVDIDYAEHGFNCRFRVAMPSLNLNSFAASH